MVVPVVEGGGDGGAEAEVEDTAEDVPIPTGNPLEAGGYMGCTTGMGPKRDGGERSCGAACRRLRLLISCEGGKRNRPLSMVRVSPLLFPPPSPPPPLPLPFHPTPVDGPYEEGMACGG